MTNLLAPPVGALPGNALPNDVFAAITELARTEAGLSIPESKRSLVQSRIAKRLRELGMTDFRAYVDLVASERGRSERQQMVSVLTTNVSSFFRESHHFETLREALATLLERARGGTAVRIWSAGCSSGQEPYSIAMTLLDIDSTVSRLDVRVLATDIDVQILDIARRGEYAATQLTGVPDRYRSNYFAHVGDGTWTVGPDVRGLVAFRQLNLLQPWPMKRRFDVIFCRNVVIYFDEATQASLWPRFRRHMHEDALLCVGHSERIVRPETVALRPAGLTTYRAFERRTPPGADPEGPPPKNRGHPRHVT